MNLSTDIKKIRQVIKSSLLDGNQQQSFIKRLDFIERRWSDGNLYVGIVGEFSSGKSTLINALIGQDYFVTNSLQGTTTVITSIRYGSFINLELKYKNGEIVKYSNHKLALIEKFLPEEFSQLSFSDKLKIKAGDFFSLNGKDDFMLRIFDVVTTSNRISKELDEVTVYYPSDFLKNGIVLIDTPGTDSLIPEHTEITKNAIATKCNLAFVIIPALAPVSVTLSDFISENLEHCIDHCHFLVTKIEMIRDDRQAHLIGVSKRLINSLEIENPHVIAAPTLLSLEERQIIEQTGLLSKLSQEEKKSLISTYNKDIANLFSNISKNKSRSKQATTEKLLKDLLSNVLIELNKLLQNKENLLRRKQSNRTMPLETILSRLNRNDIATSHELVLDRIKSRFSSERSAFEREVYSDISIADTKDEIQGTIRSEYVMKLGQSGFQSCYNYVIEQTNWLISYYKDSINKFENEFRTSYALESLGFSPSVDSSLISIKNYKNSFSSSSLSTFPLKRMFIKKETIRSEMRVAVREYLIAKYGRLFNFYSSKVIKLDEKLGRQVEKLLQQYAKKYTKTINSRIAQELEIEKSITTEINSIRSHIHDIETIMK